MKSRLLIRCIFLLSLVLVGCDNFTKTQTQVLAWFEQINQSLHSILARFNQQTNEDESPHIINKAKPVDKAKEMQAQAQLIGAMETMSVTPVDGQENRQADNRNIKQLRHDFDKAVSAEDRRDALLALIKVDKNNVVTLLRDAYADLDPEVRKEAVLQMPTVSHQKAIVDLLLQALNDPDSSVVIEAVEGLAHVQDKRAIAGLKKMAITHPDEDVRLVAQDYLGQSSE